MSSPMTPTLPGSSGYGLAWKAVTVLSVDGNLANVRDQLSATFWVSRVNLRYKGSPPQVGEQWIVDRSYGNDWTFAMLINQPIPFARPPLMYVVANGAARDAILNPDNGMIIFRCDWYQHEGYDATSDTWIPLPRVGLIRRWDPLADLSLTGGTETVDPATVTTWNFNLARQYKLSYTTRFSQTNAGGTMGVAFRYVAGNGPLLPTSSRFLTFTVPGNGANNAGLTTFKALPPGLSGTYTVGVSLFSGSGGGNATAYGSASGEGRTAILEDMGVSQQ
jgi:hypothetical protein